jgi:predicted dehydrogenase
MASKFGMACMGITHPHVSVRLDVARRLDGIELIGVSDPDPANADGLKALSEHLGVPIFEPEELLANKAVHGVVVEPWTYEMVDMTLRCVEAGKNVLVEKPGGSNPKELQRLVAAAASSDRVVQVGYNFRFSPMVEFAAEIIKSGVLGKLVQAQVHAAGPTGDSKYRWFNLPNDLGGCFWEDGCHIMDLIVHLFGQPKRVTAHVSKFPTVSGPESMEDAVVAALEWESMLMGFDFTSWEANDWLETWQFNLYGSEGTLRFQMLPERYELYLRKPWKNFRAGWTRWNETTFAVPWAGQPTAWEKLSIGMQI